MIPGLVECPVCHAIGRGVEVHGPVLRPECGVVPCPRATSRVPKVLAPAKIVSAPRGYPWEMLEKVNGAADAVETATGRRPRHIVAGNKVPAPWLEELQRIEREEVPKLEVSREKVILARDALRLSALRAILAEIRYVEGDSECDFGDLSPTMEKIQEIARLGLGSDPELPERSTR